MPTVTVRLSADEKADLEALASREGLSLSEYVRRALHVLRTGPNVETALEDHESRLARLEELAGF